MQLYEVKVKTVSSVYVLIEARSADDAEARWKTAGVRDAEFVESEEPISVVLYDDRFDDAELVADEYDYEFAGEDD